MAEKRGKDAVLTSPQVLMEPRVLLPGGEVAVELPVGLELQIPRMHPAGRVVLPDEVQSGSFLESL